MKPGQRQEGWRERAINRRWTQSFADNPTEITAQNDGTCFTLPNNSFLQSIQLRTDSSGRNKKTCITLFVKPECIHLYTKLADIPGVSNRPSMAYHSYSIENEDFSSQHGQEQLWNFLNAADEISPIRQSLLNRIATCLGIAPPSIQSLKQLCLKTIFCNEVLRDQASTPGKLPTELAAQILPLAAPVPMQANVEPLSFPRVAPKPQTQVSSLSVNLPTRTPSPIMRTSSPFVDHVQTPPSRTNTPVLGCF